MSASTCAQMPCPSCGAMISPREYGIFGSCRACAEARRQAEQSALQARYEAALASVRAERLPEAWQPPANFTIAPPPSISLSPLTDPITVTRLDRGTGVCALHGAFTVAVEDGCGQEQCPHCAAAWQRAVRDAARGHVWLCRADLRPAAQDAAIASSSPAEAVRLMREELRAVVRNRQARHLPPAPPATSLPPRALPLPGVRDALGGQVYLRPAETSHSPVHEDPYHSWAPLTDPWVEETIPGALLREDGSPIGHGARVTSTCGWPEVMCRAWRYGIPASWMSERRSDLENPGHEAVVCVGGRDRGAWFAPVPAPEQEQPEPAPEHASATWWEAMLAIRAGDWDAFYVRHRRNRWLLESLELRTDAQLRARMEQAIELEQWQSAAACAMILEQRQAAAQSQSATAPGPAPSGPRRGNLGDALALALGQ